MVAVRKRLTELTFNRFSKTRMALDNVPWSSKGSHLRFWIMAGTGGGGPETCGRAHGEVGDLRRTLGTLGGQAAGRVAAANPKNTELNERTQFGLAPVVFKRGYHRWI
jgi:hypothetical protein